jgi:hypothetical protein
VDMWSRVAEPGAEEKLLPTIRPAHAVEETAALSTELRGRPPVHDAATYADRARCCGSADSAVG